MNKRDLMVGILILVGIPASMFIGVCIGQSVGERAPSPSPSGSTHSTWPLVERVVLGADSEAAPARSLETGASGTQSTGRADSDPEHPVWSAVVEGGGAASERPAPASTVTQSALTATATVVIDPVPATPVATSRAVETLAPKSINSYDPWPAYLWPVVECLIARESKGDPYAVGLAGERGLLQVHPITWGYLARYGITPDALFDPATNIRAAYLLYIEAGGLRPWGGGCA